MKKIIVFTMLLFAIISFTGCEFCTITVDSKVIHNKRTRIRLTELCGSYLINSKIGSAVVT